MKSVAWILFAVLAVIALIHVYWGLGGLWPASSERALIDLVIGDSRFERMPSTGLTLIVALLIGLAGLIALRRVRIIAIGPSWIAAVGSWVLACVFGLRGLSTYLFAIGLRDLSPFATDAFIYWDRWLYAPLCLVIAMGFVWLGLRGGAAADQR